MQSAKRSVLFFSRGRGHGHALDDLELSQAISIRRPELDITFASYATGAKTFRDVGRDFIDLELPENNPYLETLQKAYRTIQTVRADLVVCHEEFAALAAADLLGIPSIFLSPWLPPLGSILEESLQCCDSIVLMGDPGIFPLPRNSRAMVNFSAPFIRPVAHTVADRDALRQEMGIPAGAFVVIVIPGGWATEERAPIANLVVPAFEAVECAAGKQLYWLSASDQDFLKQRCRHNPNIFIRPFANPVSRFMAASNLVVSKGTRGATLEAGTVGVPSLSLSHGLNPVDEILVPRIRSNIALNARAATIALVHEYFQRVAQGDDLAGERSEDRRSDRPPAGEVLTMEIERLLALAN